MSTCPCQTISFQDMAELETLLRHVIPVIPELPHSMALDRLRQAYIEFARKTSLITIRMVLDYQAGVNDYELQAPDGYEIYNVEGIEHHGGFWWADGLPGYVGGLQDNWDTIWRGSTGFYMLSNNVLCLRQTPSADEVGGLKVYATLLPTDCVNDIPVAISVPFGNGIAKRVIADALCIPNKGWTHPDLARKYETEYSRTVLAGKQLASRNRQRGPLTARAARIL